MKNVNADATKEKIVHVKKNVLVEIVNVMNATAKNVLVKNAILKNALARTS